MDYSIIKIGVEVINRIQIYYFSGTGNTAFVVKKLAKELESLGNVVNIDSCENIKEINNDFDVLGIAFPIHSSYAPKVFSELLDKLPKVNNMPLFGIVTCGYIAGDVLRFEGKKLETKGYVPFLYRNILVGNNMHLPKLCPLKVTTKEKLDKRLIKINNQIIDISIKVNNKTKDIRGNNILGKIFGISQRVFGKIHTKHNFKGFEADESCTKCKLCIKNCPTKNIVLKDNKVIFEDKCIVCMRCYNFCPTKSIQMTNKTKNIEKYIRYKGPKGLGSKTQVNK
ncbi:MAG: EFR1 family ferrodoxin [Clostridium sp.]